MTHKYKAIRCPLCNEAAGHCIEELSADPLPSALRRHVQIVQERAEGRMAVRENASESCQLRARFGKDRKKRAACPLGEARFPQSGALGVGAVIEVIV
jgi:hypothetical protein